MDLTRDPHIIGRRIRQMHKLPWVLPATLLLKFTDQDLDDLDLAEQAGSDAYWLALARIVRRLTEERGER